MNQAAKITRRLGSSPRERGSTTNTSCPDIFELTDGQFAIIGTDVTEEINSQLPGDAQLHGQRVVIITRDTLLRAKPDILDAS